MQPDKILEDLQQQMHENSVNMKTLIIQNESIKDLLTGNKMNPLDKGILGSIQNLQQEHKDLKALLILKDEAQGIRIGKLEKFRDKVLWLSMGGGAVAGWSITDLLGKIFQKH